VAAERLTTASRSGVIQLWQPLASRFTPRDRKRFLDRAKAIADNGYETYTNVRGGAHGSDHTQAIHGNAGRRGGVDAPDHGTRTGDRQGHAVYGTAGKNLHRRCARLREKDRIKPTFLRLSAGEAVNRIRAEKNSPQASVLYGIGLPSMLTLKADGLLQPYKSPEAAAISDRYKDPEGFWTGSDVDFIGIASNKKFLGKKN
jgi:hypothetical protein